MHLEDAGRGREPRNADSRSWKIKGGILTGACRRTSSVGTLSLALRLMSDF